MKLIMRFIFYSAIFVLLVFGGVWAWSGSNDGRLLSAKMTLQENSPERITVTWKQETPGNEPERMLLFVPGTVADASCVVAHFVWSVTSETGGVWQGDEKTFSMEFPCVKPPNASLRELGFLAGARLASLALDLRSAVPGEEKKTILFSQGMIEIQFPKRDAGTFRDFPKAIDVIAKKLVSNYPPLRSMEIENSPIHFPVYLQKKSLKITTGDSGILTIPVERVCRTWGGNLAVRSLALFLDQQPIPFIILDENGQRKSSGMLAPQDAIQFYCPRSSSPYSPLNAIWITPEEASHCEPGAIPAASSSLDSRPLMQKIHLEEDHLFIGDQDKNEKQALYWMWHDFIQDGTKTVEFQIPADAVASSATAVIRLAVNQSYISLATDALACVVNGQKIPVILDPPKMDEYRTSVALVPGVLKPGGNQMGLNVQLERVDRRADVNVCLDWVNLEISTHVVPSATAFENPEGRTGTEISGSNGGVWLIRGEGKVPGDVLYAGARTKAAGFPKDATAWRIEVLPDTRARTLCEWEEVAPRVANPLLTDAGSADVILIAPRGWISDLQPFAESLRREGYRVRLAAREDLDDLFGDGRMSPYPIRDFLRYAYAHWDSPRPSYVLLVGDATWDYWGRYHNNVRNYIPAIRENEKYATENWFARLDNQTDRIPDCLIARWPVQAATEVQIVAEKTIRYKESPVLGAWFNKVFVLTDDTFETYTEELANQWIPAGMRTLRRDVADYPLIDNIYLPEHLREQFRAKTSPPATEEIIRRINEGFFLWVYFGHGAPNVMGEERLFFGGGSKFSDVRKLTNINQLPMLWAFTCETATFDYPRDKWNVSIGEDLLTFPNGGAIALVGATGRGYPTDHIQLARGMHEAAFHDGFSTLGEILFAAQLYGMGQNPYFEPLDQFALLGDPTLPFPIFHEIQGTIQAEEDSLAYDWQVVPEDQKSVYSLWQETDKEILSNPQDRLIPTMGKIQGTLPLEKGKEQPEKIGIDSVRREDERIVVAHGAIVPPRKSSAASLIVPATGRLPDLQFVDDSLRIEPSSPRSGETIFFRAMVSNTGTASATRVTVEGVDLSGNNSKPLEVVVGQTGARIERIDPGQQVPVQIRWDPTHDAGSHHVRLTVDELKRIPESNEENNWIFGDLTVLRKADLIVDASRTDVQPIENGKRLQLYFEVRNQGESPAEKIVLELIRKDVGAAAPETFRFPKAYEIAAGDHISFGGIKMPANIEYLEIVVDPDNFIDEETHANNRYRYTVGS